MLSISVVSLGSIQTQQTTHACLKVSSADYHCSYLFVRWAVANDESRLKVKIGSLAAVLIVTAVTDALLDQVIFERSVLGEAVG